MNEVTVTIWVNSTDFKYFTEVLKVISELPFNYFDYKFRAEDIKYSKEKMIGAWFQLNLPISLFLKWEICYRTNINEI